MNSEIYVRVASGATLGPSYLCSATPEYGTTFVEITLGLGFLYVRDYFRMGLL